MIENTFLALTSYQPLINTRKTLIIQIYTTSLNLSRRVSSGCLPAAGKAPPPDTEPTWERFSYCEREFSDPVLKFSDLRRASRSLLFQIFTKNRS